MSKPVTVYADGVFDLTHYGHHRLLRKAKNLGDSLVVGVHLDDDVVSYKRKPVLSHHERTENLVSIGFIDKIVVGPLIITEEFMKEHEIDIVVHAHSPDEEDRYREMYKIPSKLGKFRRLDYTPEISTTDILKRMSDY